MTARVSISPRRGRSAKAWAWSASASASGWRVELSASSQNEQRDARARPGSERTEVAGQRRGTSRGTVRRSLTPQSNATMSMSTRRNTVLIADDHAIVKEGLVSLLKEHDFDVVGAVGDGQLLIEAARRLRPDVIVTDLSMPGWAGSTCLRCSNRAHRQQSGRAHDAQRRREGDAGDACRRLRVFVEGVGGRRTVNAIQPGAAGPRLPRAGGNQGRHGADGAPRKRGGAGTHAAST